MKDGFSKICVIGFFLIFLIVALTPMKKSETQTSGVYPMKNTAVFAVIEMVSPIN